MTSFAKFAFYCRDENPEWLRILSERNTFFFSVLIKDLYFSAKEEEKINSEEQEEI